MSEQEWTKLGTIARLTDELAQAIAATTEEHILRAIAERETRGLRDRLAVVRSEMQSWIDKDVAASKRLRHALNETAWAEVEAEHRVCRYVLALLVAPPAPASVPKE